LVVRIRDPHDGSAWIEFVDIYSPVLYRFLQRRGLQDADAADVMQEVFRTVARSVKDFRGRCGRGSFRRWLMTIARSRVCDFLARRARQARGSGDTEVLKLMEEQPAEMNGEDFLEQEYRRSVLDWAAEQIRGEFQQSTWQAFWETNVEGKDTKSVAKSLGMSIGAVYIARSRVLARLKKQVRKIEEDEESPNK
jgi:RNA polymerase sigma-70 factor (ECF subfamily)